MSSPSAGGGGAQLDRARARRARHPARRDSTANDRWSLAEGGEYYGVGAGSGIAGFRADLALGDDFFGKREDAYSEPMRNKRWDWYRDDFSARLKPRAKRIMMNTHWHELDVAGHVIEDIKSGRVRGKVIKIHRPGRGGRRPRPCPRRVAVGRSRRLRLCRFLRQRKLETHADDVGGALSAAPGARGGRLLQARLAADLPEPAAPGRASRSTAPRLRGHRRRRRLDSARRRRINADGRMYVVDLYRAQASSDRWVEALCDLVLKWKPLTWAEERGQIAAGVGPFLERRMRERQAFVARESFPSRHDKSVRAQSTEGRSGRGRLPPGIGHKQAPITTAGVKIPSAGQRFQIPPELQLGGRAT